MDAMAAQLGNLRRSMLGGGPDPAPLLTPAQPAGLSRAVRLLLLVVAAAFALFTLFYSPSSAGVMVGLWMLSALVLAMVGFRPLLAWRLAWLLGLISVLVDLSVWIENPGTSWFPAQVVVFLLILFAVGTAQHRGVLLWVWLASTGLAVLGSTASGYSGSGYYAFDRFGALLLVTGALLSGYLVRLGARAQQRLSVAQEHGTVLTERARIARELHDVVAHHVSMIAVRAETAPYRLDGLSEPARAELAEISQASRLALAEMRRLLGVLRSDDPHPPTAPQPGIADLPELVRAARAAGSNEITLDIDPSLPPLPTAVDVSAYRIVQEALTNAARHAPAAPVRVVVGRAGTGLALVIRNGPGRSSRPDGRPGHGVRGMRERAAMLGGELSALPVAGGGFEVAATLPVRTDLSVRADT